MMVSTWRGSLAAGVVNAIWVGLWLACLLSGALWAAAFVLAAGSSAVYGRELTSSDWLLVADVMIVSTLAIVLALRALPRRRFDAATLAVICFNVFTLAWMGSRVPLVVTLIVDPLALVFLVLAVARRQIDPATVFILGVAVTATLVVGATGGLTPSELT